MKIKEHVYLYDRGNDHPRRWELRWSEPNGDATTERRRRFADRDDAIRAGLTVHALVSTREAGTSLLDQELGNRGRLDVCRETYRTWLIDAGRTAKHAVAVSHVLRRLGAAHQIEYCDQITYEVLSAFLRRYQDTADRGHHIASKIKAFLRRMRKKFGIRIAAAALTFGEDRELPPVREPVRPGCWSTEQVQRLITALLEPDRVDDLPSGTGKGIASAESIQRRRTRLWYRRRMSFAPLFFFMLRYGFRPVNASQLKVAHWNDALQRLEIPKGTSNKAAPRLIILDDATAGIIRWCVRGKGPEEPIFSPRYARRDQLAPRWRRASMALIMRRVITSAQVRGSLYWLRHTALTNLCREFGGDLKLVAMISGHTQVRSLQRYLQIPDDRRDLAARYFNALDRSAPVVPQQFHGCLPDSTVPAYLDVRSMPTIRDASSWATPAIPHPSEPGHDPDAPPTASPVAV